jgi:hypothetical protein
MKHTPRTRARAPAPRTQRVSARCTRAASGWRERLARARSSLRTALCAALERPSRRPPRAALNRAGAAGAEVRRAPAMPAARRRLRAQRALSVTPTLSACRTHTSAGVVGADTKSAPDPLAVRIVAKGALRLR